MRSAGKGMAVLETQPSQSALQQMDTMYFLGRAQTSMQPSIRVLFVIFRARRVGDEGNGGILGTIDNRRFETDFIIIEQ